MKKITLVLMVMLLLPSFSMAQLQSVSYDNWFEEGNNAYNEGNYEQALTCYGQIVAVGMESAALYYNLGNTYYKMKDYPKAILNYEKSLKLDPGNEDARTNLEIANMAIVDKINPVPQSFIVRWWSSLKSALSADGWAWLSVALFGTLLLCLFAFLMSRRTGMRKAGFFLGLIVLIFLALSLVFAVGKRRDLTVRDEAIVMTPTVTVKSSPSEASVDLFVLHEGTKVRILDSTGEWNKIKIADGTVGWLQAAHMEAF